MADPNDPADPRRHTGRLLDVLRGKAPAPPPQAREPPQIREAAPPRSYGARRPPPPPASPRLRASPLKPLADHLRAPQGPLVGLLERNRELAELNRVLQAYLPPSLRGHVLLSRLDAEVWVLQTESPAYATRLRFALRSLRDELAAQLKRPVPPLKVRIVPPTDPPAPPPRRLVADGGTAALLEGAARAQGDTPLGQALRRLAGHARDSGGSHS